MRLPARSHRRFSGRFSRLLCSWSCRATPFGPDPLWAASSAFGAAQTKNSGAESAAAGANDLSVTSYTDNRAIEGTQAAHSALSSAESSSGGIQTGDGLSPVYVQTLDLGNGERAALTSANPVKTLVNCH